MSAVHQNMTLLQQLGQLGFRLLALTAVAACTLLGYGVYMFVSDTGLGSVIWEAYMSVSASAGRMFGLHPIVASLLLPALITSLLALGAVFYMYKKS